VTSDLGEPIELALKHVECQSTLTRAWSVMPTYEYACTECGHRFETVQSFTDDALTECPSCGGVLRKVFGSVGIVFKGSGFYKTDTRGASSASTPPASETSSSSESGTKESSSSKESGSPKETSTPKPTTPSESKSSSDA
jgi:putative FmdB family regulatory protein